MYFTLQSAASAGPEQRLPNTLTPSPALRPSVLTMSPDIVYGTNSLHAGAAIFPIIRAFRLAGLCGRDSGRASAP
jgi:hypothetical protein